MIEKEKVVEQPKDTETINNDNIYTANSFNDVPRGFFKRHQKAVIVLLCSLCILVACIIRLTANEGFNKPAVDADTQETENTTEENTAEEIVTEETNSETVSGDKKVEIIVDENGNRAFVRPENIKPSPLDESKIDPQFPSDISRALKVNMVTSPSKVAYLTFDDGPSDNTEKILEILKKYDVKATFFVLGEKCELRPDLVKKIFDEGHTVANHTYSHDYEKVYESPQSLRDEIYKTEDIIASIIGRENVMKLFRFPGGAMSPQQSAMRADFETFGYKYADWNALNGDAEMADYTYDHCIERIKETCSDTGDVVILMHDAPLKTMTVATLPETIEYLISQGYSFERIVP